MTVLVACPYRNDPTYIQQFLEAMQAQTCKDFEVVICDDYSTDGSLEILKQYELKYPWLEVQQNHCNLGIGRTLNSIIEPRLEKYDYFTYFGVDDKAYPNYIEMHLKFIRGYNASFSGFRHVGTINDGLITIPRANLRHHYMFGVSYMFDRDVFALGGPYTQAPAEDYMFWIKASIPGILKFKFFDSVLQDYRWRDGAVSSTPPDISRHIQLMNKYLRSY
jgi:glycosyltransferase involved in cell wall biosynthesis